MAETQSESSGSSNEVTTEAKKGFLDLAIKATKQTDRSKAESLLKTFAEQALQGQVTFDKNLTKSIKKAIQGIDEMVSKQLAKVMHHPDFQKLEGSWRGLKYLVSNSETGPQMKLRVLNCSKDTLKKDLANASEFDQSHIFKKVYESEFGTAGGQPYGALIGDYEFENHPEDLQMLRGISSVAAGAFAPFIASTSCKMFGMSSWTELNTPRDLATFFDAPSYAAWKSFRETEDSRFVVLTMPRTLARLPYGSNTSVVEEFNYEEVKLGKDGSSVTVDHDDYCWMSTAYVLGARMTDAFAQYGWCTAIRGMEGGGKVDNLPLHTYRGEDGDTEIKCPTEVLIPDRREKEISDCGFLPLVNWKGTDKSVFISGQTAQKPKKYEGKDGDYATANAAISARLPYIMATSRIAHFLKVMARDKLGSFMEASECELWLNNWIKNYTSADSSPSQEMKARYPLADSKIVVKEVPGAPGSYNATAYLRPWLQFEELTTSMRLVAKIKQGT